MGGEIDHRPMQSAASITIRRAYADDATALIRLAARDSAAVREGAFLWAEVDGELGAAVPLADGSAIADPFYPTLGLLELLRKHATAATPTRAPRWAFRPRLA